MRLLKTPKSKTIPIQAALVNDDLRPDGKGLQPLAPGRLDGLLDHLNVMECIDNKLKPILGFEVKGKIFTVSLIKCCCSK